jgi:hypothetical protein
MLKKVLVGLSVVAAGAVAVVARRPSEYRVSRSTTIAASPAVLFPYVDDLVKFNTWNPWLKLDPTAHVTYYGAPAGQSASMAWSGDKNVGQGRMTITDSQPNERIRIRLDFVKPFASTAHAEFLFMPQDGRTAVTWSMWGESSMMAKAMGLVMDMDAMIGGQFEKGLADLKGRVEATAKEGGR